MLSFESVCVCVLIFKIENTSRSRAPNAWSDLMLQKYRQRNTRMVGGDGTDVEP